jgi:hypothetical protein
MDEANPLTRGAPAVLDHRVDLRREHNPRRKNPRQRRAMAARRDQGHQSFGTQRLGTFADVWPGTRP